MRRRSAIDSIASCAATLLRDRAPPPFISRVSESCRSQNSEKKKKKARPLVCGGAGGGHVYALSLSLSFASGRRARACSGGSVGMSSGEPGRPASKDLRRRSSRLVEPALVGRYELYTEALSQESESPFEANFSNLARERERAAASSSRETCLSQVSHGPRFLILKKKKRSDAGREYASSVESMRASSALLENCL